MSYEQDWKELLKQLQAVFDKPESNPEIEWLKNIIGNAPSAYIALAMEEMKPEHAVLVFKALDKEVATDVLAKLDPDSTKDIVAKLNSEELVSLIQPLPPRETAAVLAEVPSEQLQTYINDASADILTINDVQLRLNYEKGTAGRLMTIQFVSLHKGMTIAEARQQVRNTNPKVDIPGDLYVVAHKKISKQIKNQLLGVISVRDLLMHDTNVLVEDIMVTDVVSINADADEEYAAALLSKYKFVALPVTDKDGYLVGVIPADDLMPVIVARLRRLYSQAIGTDAETMEKLSPFQAAKLRVPWLLGTMVIELCAGLVISHFNGVLEKIILLASFMPVISAISGNVGLQAAAITVRALDTKSGNTRNIFAAIKKEGATSLFMALICGLVLGTVGSIWAKHIPFGIVIGVALTCSMLTAGLMGTIIPVLSKRLGFDPATTAGPFETAFQDVVGFLVFLWLATLFQHWIS